MDWRLLLTVFGTVFLAELGDKTQLATMIFATQQDGSRWTVFFGASLALVATSALGVLVGGALTQVLPQKTLNLAAAAGFIIIGIWMVFRT
jgi:putative Ca2+/H+ antiporter (TMEM165/GDT1 family)